MPLYCLTLVWNHFNIELNVCKNKIYNVRPWHLCYCLKASNNKRDETIHKDYPKKKSEKSDVQKANKSAANTTSKETCVPPTDTKNKNSENCDAYWKQGKENVEDFFALGRDKKTKKNQKILEMLRRSPSHQQEVQKRKNLLLPNTKRSIKVQTKNQKTRLTKILMMAELQNLP